MTPEKSLRYHSGECNLQKAADLKFTGIFRADFHPGSGSIADYQGPAILLTLPGRGGGGRAYGLFVKNNLFTKLVTC